MIPLILQLLACGPDAERGHVQATLGPFNVLVDKATGRMDIRGAHGTWSDVALLAGPAHAPEVQFNLGSFRFPDVPQDTVPVTALLSSQLTQEGLTLQLAHPDGPIGLDLRWDAATTMLVLSATPPAASPGLWTGLSAACPADPAFTGLGSHAMDVDHAGHAFPLWVSEPGIGKSDNEDLPEAWFLEGTRHASSYPVPVVLEPSRPAGLLVDTTRRVEVDLCATSDRWSARAWGPADLRLFEADTPLDLVRTVNGFTGRPPLPPAWALTPWADAIRGVDRVRQVADDLRAAGAPVGVIWSEDWKGASQTSTGYRLSEEWRLDTTLYPDTLAFDAELEAKGYKWFAYFAPFVGMDADSGAESSAAGQLLKDPTGADYTFTGITFKPTGHLDLSSPSTWARDRMRDVVDLGFDGWMTDYGEWVPTDAVQADGSDGWAAHQAFPAAWQRLNREVLDPVGGTFFCRSGWIDTSGQCPIVWVGDQRTSFDADDGLPSVIPLVLGLSWSGVPITTHDVAGYQSLGNPPSDKELWFRWAALGAFSPIFRTHHGSFDSDNWQFDSDAETLARYAELTRQHMALWPYRYALAKQASEDGTPMVLPTSMLFEGESWGRLDVWMLGPSLLVAPVLQRGATSRQVDLPAATAWYDWWTGAEATSGTWQVPLDHIPVFVPKGSVIPLFDVIPDTLSELADPALVGFDTADGSRELRVYGLPATFTEADGTTYEFSGTIAAPTQVVLSGDSVNETVDGLNVRITGARVRTWSILVWP